jgi:hypothetical protein
MTKLIGDETFLKNENSLDLSTKKIKKFYYCTDVYCIMCNRPVTWRWNADKYPHVVQQCIFDNRGHPIKKLFYTLGCKCGGSAEDDENDFPFVG